MPQTHASRSVGAVYQSHPPVCLDLPAGRRWARPPVRRPPSPHYSRWQLSGAASRRRHNSPRGGTSPGRSPPRHWPPEGRGPPTVWRSGRRRPN